MLVVFQRNLCTKLLYQVCLDATTITNLPRHNFIALKTEFKNLKYSLYMYVKIKYICNGIHDLVANLLGQIPRGEIQKRPTLQQKHTHFCSMLQCTECEWKSCKKFKGEGPPELQKCPSTRGNNKLSEHWAGFHVQEP